MTLNGWSIKCRLVKWSPHHEWCLTSEQGKCLKKKPKCGSPQNDFKIVNCICYEKLVLRYNLHTSAYLRQASLVKSGFDKLYGPHKYMLYRHTVAERVRESECVCLVFPLDEILQCFFKKSLLRFGLTSWICLVWQ